MIRLKGKYAEGIVFSDSREESGIRQIQSLLDQPFSKGANPRFMPDYHAGLGSVIGTTMLVTDEICPNLVGVDIGCGIRTEIFFSERDLDFEKLDQYIRKKIPAGFKVHSKEKNGDFINGLSMKKYLKDLPRLRRSLGTLGGGNHYIEVGASGKEKEFVLTVHSGSRNLGLQVAEFYQKQAVEQTRKRGRKVPPGLETLKVDSKLCRDYLRDMNICIEFARENRREITEIIFEYLGGERIEGFETVHNYIEEGKEGPDILRKGAVAAYKGHHLAIPMNMKDGFLICEGLGNAKWNYSAPHGAGRLMSRGQAKKNLSVEEYKNSMKGIFTRSVSERTLDEAPKAYKPMDEIVKYIGETVKILKHIKPIYNFKAD